MRRLVAGSSVQECICPTQEKRLAQRTVIKLEDDIDGSEASQTVRFTYEGVAYELDLNDKNVKKYH